MWTVIQKLFGKTKKEFFLRIPNSFVKSKKKVTKEKFRDQKTPTHTERTEKKTLRKTKSLSRIKSGKKNER